MEKLNILEVKQIEDHYELTLNGKFELTCDFVELWNELLKLKDEKHIDKIMFM